MKILHFLSAFVLVCCAAGALANEPVQIQQILQSTKGWDGSTLPGFTSGQTEMRVVTFKIEPGGKTSVHAHPVNGAGYIISGELTMYSTSDSAGDFSDSAKVKKIVLTAGDSWAESVNTWHYGENNGKDDVNFIVVFAGTKGIPSTLSLHKYKE